MRFTLRQLEYFVATGECGSIRLASERIHVSQPSISTAISQLEQEFGITLFVRQHAQGLSLTPAGRRFHSEANRILNRAEALYSVADELSNQIRGPYSIGCMVTVAPKLLPLLCYSFAELYPDVRIVTKVADHKTLMEYLSNADVDIAITYDLSTSEGVNFLPLAVLKPFVLLSAQSRFAKRSSILLEEVIDEPYILLDLPYSRDYFLSLFYAAGLKPNVHTSSPYPEVIRTMVANGYGYTLMNLQNDLEFSLDGQRLVPLMLNGSHQPMVIGLSTPNGQKKTRLQNAFVDHCKAHIHALKAPLSATELSSM